MKASIINIITFSRIFLAMIIFILLTQNDSYFLALILFFLAGITDYIDGALARKFSVTSQLGEIIDPIADKILIIFLFFGLSISLSSYWIGFIASIIISREIWVAALRDFNSRNNNTNATKVQMLLSDENNCPDRKLLQETAESSLRKMLKQSDSSQEEKEQIIKDYFIDGEDRVEEAEKKKVKLNYEEVRNEIYGMNYSEWKKKYKKPID